MLSCAAPHQLRKPTVEIVETAFYPANSIKMQTVLSRPVTSASASLRKDATVSSSVRTPVVVAPRSAPSTSAVCRATATPAAFSNGFGPSSSDPWSNLWGSPRSSQRSTSNPWGGSPATDPWGRTATPASPAAGGEAVRDFDGRYGRQDNSAPSAASSTATTAAPTTPSEREPSMEEVLAELSPEEQKNVKLFQECSRSVVNVSTTFNTQCGMFPMNMLMMPRGVGSGFVWDREGHVITNAHVIRGAETVSVTLSDQTVANAKVIGKDVEKDVAVLKLELTPEQKAKLTPVTLGSSTRLLVGQKVVAIGNPFSLDTSCSQGIVSGLGREINAPPSMNGYASIPISGVIQTDAAINPGNSGGPLLDARGRVVGINTAIASVTGGSSGVGFAIPIDTVKGLVAQILTHGRTLRPALGISLAPPAFLKQALADSDEKVEGVLVLGVRAGGPAEVAGVQPTRREVWGQTVLGDVITAVNGKKVKSQKDLFAALDACRVGETVELSLYRGSGNERTVKLQLVDREKLSAFD